jgi:aminoglycoside phosphotransferase (APT) family kinase protein
MAPLTKKTVTKLRNEIDAMRLIGDRTRVPVPRVFGYEVDSNNPIGVAFILMEFLPGNVAIDANGGYATNKGQIPHEHRPSFYNSVAQIQVS